MVVFYWSFRQGSKCIGSSQFSMHSSLSARRSVLSFRPAG